MWEGSFLGGQTVSPQPRASVRPGVWFCGPCRCLGPYARISDSASLWEPLSPQDSESVSGVLPDRRP